MFDVLARRTVLHRLAVAGAVGVAGCSGEDDPTTTAAETPTASDTPTDSPTPSPPPETETPEQPCPEQADATVRWRRKTGKRNFEPVVDDGSVYFGSGASGGSLRAVSLVDGAELWRTPTEGSLYAPPTLGSDGVYYTNYDSVGAFAQSDGTERWRHETTGGVPVPATADGELVFVGESNHPTPQTTVDDEFDRLLSLDRDGRVRWRTRFAPDTRAPLETAPVVASETVITASGDSTVRVFDRADGDVLWTSSIPEPYDLTVFDAGGVESVAVASRGGVEALAVADGRTVWRDRIGVNRVTVGGKRAFAANGDELRALDANDGTLLWRRSAFEGRVVGLTADDDRLLVSVESADEETLRVAELARDSGCTTRSFEIEGGWLSPPAFGGDLAVISTGSGDESVYAVETSGG